MNRERWERHATRWSWLIAGVGAALFVLRLCLETEPARVWPSVVLALLCPLGTYVGRRLSLSPLWVLWLYVAWPASSPSMAMAVGSVASLALLVQNLKNSRQTASRPTTLCDGLIFLVALAVYIATLSPTILPADSGEFQIVGPTLSVAHPPGYALYTMIAKLFSLLPFGEIAWRVNLLSAIAGALTLVVVGRTARRITGTFWAGVAASSALGVSTTFWAQSTTANIRSLTILFTALCIDSLVRLVHVPPTSREGVRALAQLALFSGLGVSHHYSLAFLAPIFAVVVLWHDPGLAKRVRAWPRLALALLLPFLADLYIVVRAATGAPFGTSDLVSVGRVIDHLLGRGFGGDMFAFLRRGETPWPFFLATLWERVLVLGNILHFQFGIPLLIVSLGGFGWLLWKKRKLATLLGGTFAVMAFVVATYRAPQSVEYLMPAYVPVALCIGCAAPLVANLTAAPSRQLPRNGSQAAAQLSLLLEAKTNGATWVQSRGRLPASLLTATLLLPILSLGRSHLPSFVQLHNDRSAREYAESALLRAPPGAHILSCWHWYTPLRYLQLVEGQRTDVEVTYLYPQGATEMPQAWAQRITRELQTSGRPLIVTNKYPTYADLPYRFAPLGEAFRVYDQPAWDVPSDIERTDADLYRRPSTEDSSHERQAAIRLLGYRVVHDEEIHPGDSATVELAWQPLVRLERGYSFFVHLVGADGTPLGQHDIAHDAAPTYEPGEVLVDRHQLPVHLAAAPGTYQLVAGTYFVQDGAWERLTLQDGNDALPLAQVSISPAPLPPVTKHPLHLSFQKGPTLVGVDYDDSLPGQRRIYLHWALSEHPSLVRLYAGEQVAAEGRVPALGKEGGSLSRRYATTVLDTPTAAKGLSVVLLEPSSGAAQGAIGAWGTSRAGPTPLPRARSRQVYIPFGGDLALIDAKAQDSWIAGEMGKVTLQFVGLRSIVRDTVVSVGVRGPEGGRSISDGVPAIGALPTFKWIRGSQVRDVHILNAPVDTSGAGEITLTVYDAFTIRTLPPLDERLARQQRANVLIQQISISLQ